MDNTSQAPHLTLAGLSTPVKALATAIILTLALGMAGALGQIIVHDIIPTFFSDSGGSHMQKDAAADSMPMNPSDQPAIPSTGRGDLFSDLQEKKTAPKAEPFYKDEQFVWTLKWSHIHLFGINMIFIFMGAITVLLSTSVRSRTWLVVLPFVGVLVDILAMWLKAFVSPAFFWLHLPGGGLFGVIFGYVSLRALWEMWAKPATPSPAR